MGRGKMDFFRKWFWDRSAFVLACCVLGGLAAGWNLPASQDAVVVLAAGQIIMAIIVVVREGQLIFGNAAKKDDQK